MTCTLELAVTLIPILSIANPSQEEINAWHKKIAAFVREEKADQANIEALQSLIDEEKFLGINPNEPGLYKESPIYISIELGHPEYVPMLLANPLVTNPNQPNQWLFTPVSICAVGPHRNNQCLNLLAIAIMANHLQETDFFKTISAISVLEDQKSMLRYITQAMCSVYDDQQKKNNGISSNVQEWQADGHQNVVEHLLARRNNAHRLITRFTDTTNSSPAHAMLPVLKQLAQNFFLPLPDQS